MTPAMARRIVRGGEPFDQRGGDRGGTAQCFDHGNEAISEAGLTQIAEPGAQQDHGGGGDAGFDDQPVERVILRAPFEHRGDGVLDRRDLALELRFAGQRDLEVMDIGAGLAGERGGKFLNHAEAEILEHRHGIRQGQRSAEAIELDAQLARLLEETDRARIGIGETRDADDVARGFLGPAIVAVAEREGGGIAQREARSARGGEAVLRQRALDRGQPAADHSLKLRIERGGVGHAAVAAQVERVAQQRDGAVLERDRPADLRGIGGAFEHLTDRDAAAGRDVVARQPHEREKMAAERAADQHQFRARAVGHRHSGEGDLLERFLRESDGEIVRETGQGVRQRLAGMAARIEAELGLKRGEARAQHRNLVRRRMERRAGPQAGMDRQAGDLAAVAQRHQHQIERCAAMDGRDRIGLEQQRRLAALLEPFDRERPRSIGEQRRIELHAADTRGIGDSAIDMPDFVADQSHAATLEPAQQRRTLGIADAVGVVAHRAAQFGPVGDRSADMTKVTFEIADEAGAVARVGTLQLHIDH